METITETIAHHLQSFIATNPQGVVVLRWATATGKSSVAIQLARQLPLEVISADSRQVYLGMDIGTDKISEKIRKEIPHHLIDIVTPDQIYTAGQWKQDAAKRIDQIHTRGKTPLIVGGTGLYIDTIYKNFSMPEVAPQADRREEMMRKENSQPWFLFKQLQKIDPDEAGKHHPNSLRYVLRALEIYHITGKTKSELAKEQPVERPLLMIGLQREKEDTNRRINKRIKEMFAQGLIEEVQWLLDKWYTAQMPAMEGIGYKEIIGYLQGEYSLEKAEEFLKRNSHHYAKRQRSRFRRYIAEGKMKPKPNVTYAVYQVDEESLL